MQRLLLLLLLTLLALFSVGLHAEDTAEDDIDIDLDDIEGIGVNEDAEKRLLRGNFYYSYLVGEYYQTLYYLREWKELIGV